MKNKKFKLLLVEDNEIAQKATVLVLASKFECEVSIANSGEEALQMADENKYDLILMDVGLPGIDGIETTLKIKQSQNPNHKIPVVAITAHTDAATCQQCFDAGMVGFLAKPFSYTEMQIVLERLKLF